jgi:ABC-type sugar transport system ATPase subunit
MYQKQIDAAQLALAKITKLSASEEIAIQKKIDKHNNVAIAKYHAKRDKYDLDIASLPFVPVLKPEPKKELLQLEDGLTSVILGVRPEGFVLSDTGSLVLPYEFHERIGRDNILVCNHEASMRKSFRVILDEDDNITPGSIKATLKQNKYFVFNPLTGERII